MNWHEVESLFATGRPLSAAGREGLLASVEPDVAAQVRQLWGHADEAGPFLSASLVQRDEPATHRPGHLIAGRFVLVEMLGAGGMGEVFSARDERLGRLAALKFIRADLATSATARTRLEREAKALCALSHPGICTLYDVVWDDAEPVLVMEYLEGETLSARLARGRIPVSEVIEIAIETLDGLAYAHRAGVVHRDLKPGNMMLTPHGPKLFDFGIASQRIADASSASSTVTRDRAFLGSVSYISPEHANGRPVDARSDIFSFGCVIYEMVTGVKAFARNTNLATLAAVLESEPRPIRDLAPEVPPTLAAAVTTCLRKDPGQRYQSVSQLQDALRTLTSMQGSSLDSSVATDRSRRTPRRRALAVAAGLVVAIVGAAVALTRFDLPSRPAAAAPTLHSVAVLPFEGAANSGLEYIADGVSESVTGALSRVPTIQVTSRSRAFAYKGKNTSAQDTGLALGVQAVVTGRVSRVGDRLLIRANLIDVADGRQIWGEQYEGKENDLLRIQTELTQMVGQRLTTSPADLEAATLRAGTTADPKAYQLYLRGQYALYRDGTPETVLGFFQQALSIDPNYSLAYSGLAKYFFNMSGTLPPADAIRRARAAALRALEIDPSLAEGHLSLAMIQGWSDFDWPAAEKSLLRAIELRPNEPMARLFYGWLLIHTGRTEGAPAYVRQAFELDPLSPYFERSYASMYYACGQPLVAIDRLQRLITADASDAGAFGALAYAYLMVGRFSDAIRELERGRALFPEDHLALAYEAYAYARLGNTKAAREKYADVQRLSQTHYVAPYTYAVLAAAIQRREETISWLERARAEHDTGLAFNLAAIDPAFADVRSDPRVREILSSVTKAGLGHCTL